MADREKVITHLDDLRLFADIDVYPVVSPENWDIYSTLCDYIDQIKEEVETLPKEQEWISVKDRLPNCNGCYLVWRPHFYPDKGMPSICYFDGQNTWHDSYGVDFTRVLAPDDVSHWMPLPEQP